MAASSTDFQAFLGAFAQANSIPLEAAIAPAFDEFEAGLSATQLAGINATFGEFVFAAQSITDAADPNNYAAMLAANSTFMFHEVVGGGTNDDGSTAVSDQVIPNSTVNSPTFAGTEPLAAFAGLSGVSTTTTGNGLVRFIAGGHSSLLSPSPSLAVTTEMQTQAASFFVTGGTIVVNDTSVIAN